MIKRVLLALFGQVSTYGCCFCSVRAHNLVKGYGDGRPHERGWPRVREFEGRMSTKSFGEEWAREGIFNWRTQEQMIHCSVVPSLISCYNVLLCQQ